MAAPIAFTKSQLRIGWAVTTFMFFASFFGPAPMGDSTYKYNSIHAAIYTAFAPPAWCAFFAWVIYTSHMGYSTALSRFFSWRGFLITTRLSYAVYLTQFPIFFYNVGVNRTNDHYDFVRMLLNINETNCIIVCSIIMTLLFDTPFQNIKKILFRKPAPIKPSAEVAPKKIL